MTATTFQLKDRKGQLHDYIHTPLPLDISITVGLALAPILGQAVGELVDGLAQTILPAVLAGIGGGAPAAAGAGLAKTLLDIDVSKLGDIASAMTSLDWSKLTGAVGQGVGRLDPAVIYQLISTCSRDMAPLSQQANRKAAFESNPQELVKLVGKILSLEGFLDFGSTLTSEGTSAKVNPAPALNQGA